MKKSKNKIFIACDSTSVSKIRGIIKNSKTNELKIGYKFGLEFLNSKKGRNFVSKLKNKIIFSYDWYLSSLILILKFTDLTK